MEIRVANKNDMQKIFSLRTEVFVNEQNVPFEIELDNQDQNAVHFIAEKNGVAIACGRVIMHKDYAHVGRIAVSKDYRNKGIGKQICKYIVDYCKQSSVRCIRLNSQLHALGFYEKLGFSAKGDVFIEAGIEHMEMEMIF